VVDQEKRMVRIMLISKDSASLKGLESGLGKMNGVELVFVTSKNEVLERVDKNTIDVVVTDAELADEEPLALVTEIMQKRPLINCAMVNSLPPEDFHEYTEGLGVFMQLPLNPGEKEAEQMLEILDSIDALLKA
jgi:DNA-binding NtrC family response regulator